MVLTVDIGTSVFKSAVWDYGGKKKAFASVPLSISLSDEFASASPHHEADSRQWLAAFKNCCRRLGAETPLSAVEAIVISGHGPSLVPVLKGDRGSEAGGQGPGNSSETLHLYFSHSNLSPAAPVRLWLDRRAEKAAEQVSALIGSHVDAGFFLPKILGIKTDEPELYQNTEFFLGCPEFLAFALSGGARTVFPSDGFERWYWDDAILSSLGLDKEKFPPFIRPGESFGSLTPQIASYFGFARNVPVIAGGPDFFPAILGAGVMQPGQACDRAGTSEGINACTKNFLADKRLMCYGHPVKPHWNLSGVITTTGKAVEWGRNLLSLKQYDDFYALAETAKAGAGGLVFLPYLAGERAPVWNPSARGTLSGLSLATGSPDLARSVLEGIGFAIRDVIEAMEETGAAIGELRVAGTSSGNRLLNQIKADITGKPVHIPRQKESELLGLAIIGACALRKYSSFSEAVSALVQIEETCIPDKNNAALYDTLFKNYVRIRNYADGN